MPDPRPETASTDHARSERLHVFAHDLRNRLAGLWEVMRALRSGDPGMDPEELHAFAERGYFQAQREIEDLLDDFDVDRNIRIPEAGPIRVSDVLSEVLKREQHRLVRKGQHVSVSGDQDASARGDAHWTGQILQALISNASKFSPREAMIQVAIERQGPRILIRVKDTGVGLSGRDLEQVFVRFALLDSRSTDGEQQSRGTLARARQWSEAMEGQLTAHSDGAGTGATFTLLLPSAD